MPNPILNIEVSQNTNELPPATQAYCDAHKVKHPNEVLDSAHVNITFNLEGLTDGGRSVIQNIVLPFFKTIRTNHSIHERWDSNLVTIPIFLLQKRSLLNIVRALIEDLAEFQLQFTYEEPFYSECQAAQAAWQGRKHATAAAMDEIRVPRTHSTCSIGSEASSPSARVALFGRRSSLLNPELWAATAPDGTKSPFLGMPRGDGNTPVDPRMMELDSGSAASSVPSSPRLSR
jgi:hypothetical protein